ncbi:hypothetical protein KF728_18175 [Candidatus Obscuribacterales bacterium]|nr:hypothetical protein [Candidatus Obscuribacterales bacterium]
MELNTIRLFEGANGQSALLFDGALALWIVGGLLALAALGGLAYRVRFWWREGKKLVEQPGYVTPRAPIFARIARLIAFNFMAWRYIGPIKRIGSHHMRDKRRLIILINHQTERDVLIIPTSLRLRVVRALMAVTQIFGIRVPAAAWLGVIAVHHDKNPSAALRGMIRIMQQDEDSDAIVFPQGQLIRDNVLKREQFFDGALMIGKKTAEKSSRPVAFLPAAIAYDRDPTHATWLQRLLEGLGWKKFRDFYGETMYGAAIAFGKPIPVEDLPNDYKAAMTVVFDRIVELSQQADESLKRPVKATV